MNKRYLFRGFAPDKPFMTLVGKDTITLNGEVMHGEWVKGYLRNANTIDTYRQMEIDGQTVEVFDSSSKVIPETVGQWVTTDKNGNDVFIGDRVIVQTSNNGYSPRRRECEMDWNEKMLECLSDVPCKGDMDDIELIGNIWEAKL